MDFYELVALSNLFEFEGQLLVVAISATFKRRGATTSPGIKEGRRACGSPRGLSGSASRCPDCSGAPPHRDDLHFLLRGHRRPAWAFHPASSTLPEASTSLKRCSVSAVSVPRNGQSLVAKTSLVAAPEHRGGGYYPPPAGAVSSNSSQPTSDVSALHGDPSPKAGWNQEPRVSC